MRKELLEMEQRRLATPPAPVAVPASIVKTDDALVNELRREIAGLTATVNAIEQANKTLRAENTDLRRKVDELTREVGILQGKLDAYKNRPVVTSEPKIIYTTPPSAPAPVINYTPPAINYTPPTSVPAPIINYTPPPTATPVTAPAPRIVYRDAPTPEPIIVYRDAPAPRVVYTDTPTSASDVSGYDTYVGEETMIYFDINKTMISESAKSKLSKVAEIVNRYEEATIDIRGYTDKTGSAAYNLELSRKRAKTVKDYLANQLGLKPWQMLVYHFGEDESSTKANDPSARKVVVTFTRK